MKQVTHKIFEIDELSKASQNKAYEKWYHSAHNFNLWADDNIKALSDLCSCLCLGLVNYSLSKSDYPDYKDFIDIDCSYYEACNSIAEVKNILLESLEDYDQGYYANMELYDFCKRQINLMSDIYNLDDFINGLKATFKTIYYDDNKQHYSFNNFMESMRANETLYYADGDIYTNRGQS